MVPSIIDVWGYDRQFCQSKSCLYLRAVKVSSQHDDGVGQHIGCISTGKYIQSE